MPISPAYPGGSPNTYTPSYEAGGLLIQYLAKDFALDQYVGAKKVDHNLGQYLYIDSTDAARVVSPNDFVWPDGADARPGWDNTSGFQFLTYSTVRQYIPFALGYMSVQQASWEILAQHAAEKANRAKTEQTVRALASLTTAGNYASTHVATATALGGGLWGGATSTNFWIRKTLQAAAKQIQLDTFNSVRPSDLVCVINPNTAAKVFANDEVLNYVKSSPMAFELLEGRNKAMADNYGLPEYFGGIKFIVDGCSVVTSKKNVTTVTTFAVPDNTAVMLCKKDSVVPGMSSQFNTMTRFFVEDLTVESMDDPKNRRHECRVVWNDAMVLTAPLSGFLITNLFS